MPYEEIVTLLYREGKTLLDLTRDRSVVDDFVRWAREGLDEALLDLKLAYLEGDADAMRDGIDEALYLVAEI